MAKTIKEKSAAGISKTEVPIKITIELDLVVNIRQEQSIEIKHKKQLLKKTLLTDCPDNKFSYSFDPPNASVLSLSVEGFSKSNPGPSGNFTTCVYDASDEPSVRVTALAKENTPTGRVALILKFLGKDLFTSPKEFELGDGGLFIINTLAKLPL